ncbi:MAG TPA: type III secretion system outer membrane ring subunit SctC, partial [Duganella sp.]|uniref:type III secretion system outer membrane ring subunit SctC n=1 Tax=Duganella sp. TaxID=1904440 RepID=UPI002ED2E8F1
DNTSARLEVGEDAVQDAKAALTGLGLFDDRFGWGELPDEGVVIVSGPRSYVDLARDTLLPPAEKKFARKGKQIMMFRLKYASAMDRTITARGKTETVPGIKTILGNLLFGPSTGEKLTASGPRFDVDSPKRSRLPKNEREPAREAAGGGGVFAPLFAAPAGSGKNPLLPGAPGGDAGGAPFAAAPAPPSQQRGNDDDGRPRIEADPTLNAIMIYDNINKKEMYAALIAELDVQPQQIEIEALIVDIDRGKLSDMGVEWGIRAGAVTTTMNATTATSQGQDLPLPGATLLISNVARFYARLKAMESNGDARVLATPTVLTLDNVAAVLDLSRSAYVSLVGERVADMADITAGTMLRVIPRIIHDGGQTRVRLEVDIEDGSLDSQDGGANRGGTGTISTGVTRSTISTQAIIDTQQTLMIGGYRAESLSKNKQKVPVLGDLPVLGGLFRSESQSNSTRERLFLITPRIAGTDGADQSTRNALKARTGAAADAAGAGAPPAAAAVVAAAPAVPAATTAPA